MIVSTAKLTIIILRPIKLPNWALYSHEFSIKYLKKFFFFNKLTCSNKKNLHQYLNFNSSMALLHTPCYEKYSIFFYKKI